MSNADIAEINLLKKQQRAAESRARMLRKKREIQKRRERMIEQWIREYKIGTEEELADLYVKMLMARK